MENIGPVVLFVLYMVISSWAKQKKRKAAEQYKEGPQAPEDKSTWKPPSQVESIFNQIKKELFEEEEVELPPMEYHELEPEMEEELNIPLEEPLEPAFVEGARPFQDREASMPHVMEPAQESEERNRSLAEIMKSYTTIQQGIVLREILGKPRALQKNHEWFHLG